VRIYTIVLIYTHAHISHTHAHTHNTHNAYNVHILILTHTHTHTVVSPPVVIYMGEDKYESELLVAGHTQQSVIITPAICDLTTPTQEVVAPMCAVLRASTRVVACDSPKKTARNHVTTLLNCKAVTL